MTTTVWLTGLPSSGKSTLARVLTDRQRALRPVEHLDGDVIRADLFPELGFDRRDRMENVRRIGLLAAMFAAHDVLSVVSVIAPFRESRDAVRAAHAEQGLTFLEVYVDAPAQVCAERDVKGLYARARTGRISGLTGADAAYEAPTTPDLRLRTAESSIDECVSRIEELIALSARARLVAVADGAQG